MEKLYVLKWAIPCFSRLKSLNTQLIIIRKSRFHVCLNSIEKFMQQNSVILGNPREWFRWSFSTQSNWNVASSVHRVLTISVITLLESKAAAALVRAEALPVLPSSTGNEWNGGCLIESDSQPNVQTPWGCTGTQTQLSFIIFLNYSLVLSQFQFRSHPR